MSEKTDENDGLLDMSMPESQLSVPESAEAPQPDVTEHDVVAPTDEAVLLCARICHAATRALNDAHNEYTMDWETSRESTVAGVLYVLANPKAGPDLQHNAWMEHKRAAGWVYGATKDAEAKTHPCMVPYTALPPIQRAKDVIFGAVVREFFGLR